MADTADCQRPLTVNGPYDPPTIKSTTHRTHRTHRTVNGQRSTVDGDKYSVTVTVILTVTVNGQRPVNGRRPTINSQRVTVKGQRSTTDDQKSKGNGQRGIYRDRDSVTVTVGNGRRPTINSQGSGQRASHGHGHGHGIFILASWQSKANDQLISIP
jgi:hypothetical protein